MKSHSHLRTMMLAHTILLLVWGTMGCSTVQPWERGHLADATMQPDWDPLSIHFAEHMWFSREAASGGQGVGGGGCGCN